ncbi:uncharacterized protein GGS25DRAFT_526152 [Hypoxylon fragiforme]|uniref:uncharacterized protein n=1 Tax=Hypoxylon fragiforme TaxID=63214 RepID=UPI0020C5C7DC|nr:uncharacterized protein GGS25DRAFT_526152 [Hypoxylon fragiforme]KAI2603115.1 hypothetical protein GGS25DRAFT_526152 [Hypoxylon fragiforme]
MSTSSSSSSRPSSRREPGSPLKPRPGRFTEHIDRPSSSHEVERFLELEEFERLSLPSSSPSAEMPPRSRTLQAPLQRRNAVRRSNTAPVGLENLVSSNPNTAVDGPMGKTRAPWVNDAAFVPQRNTPQRSNTTAYPLERLMSETDAGYTSEEENGGGESRKSKSRSRSKDILDGVSTVSPLEELIRNPLAALTRGRGSSVRGSKTKDKESRETFYHGNGHRVSAQESRAHVPTPVQVLGRPDAGPSTAPLVPSRLRYESSWDTNFPTGPPPPRPKTPTDYTPTPPNAVGVLRSAWEKHSRPLTTRKR